MDSICDRLDVAVVGVGRMGRHHARIYRQLPQARLVAVVDADADRAAQAAEDFGCAACATVEDLLAQHPGLRAASVAVPTVHHLAAAQPLLSRGVACLVEKPLAPDVDEAARIVALAQEHGAVLQVGHTERFNPALRAVVTMKITPRFMQVDRVSPMTFRSLDIGVVMDLMIHDLDIVLALVDRPIDRVDAVGVAVLGHHEDIANARLVFDNGSVANLTASRLALKTQRRMRLFSEHAYVSLNYQDRDGIVLRRSEHNMAALQEVRRRLASGADLSDLDYSKLVQMDRLTMDLPPGQADPLTAELSSFLDAVRTGTQPAVDGRAGHAAIAAAARVLDSIRRHRWEGLDRPLEQFGDEA